MKKFLKITAICLLLIILSPFVALATIIIPVIILTRNGNMERFEEKLHKFTNNKHFNPNDI